MAKIRITNLRLRTIIGANEWERDVEQDIVINVVIDYDATNASKSDNLKDTIDYKTLTKKIIKHVQSSRYFLLEKLADKILTLVLDTPKVTEALVRVDKPLALRFADSVSVELTKKKLTARSS
jgi:D-erythro-7,8-dihydroneopterin triphosphate epimerase